MKKVRDMKDDIKKCLIIYNPNSGKAISEDVLAIYQDILKDNGYKVDVLATKYKNHATEIITNAKNYNIVFSIGGDGTLNEVIRGNYYRKNKLTICPLPSGTCNDVATMLGYGKNPVDNINLALDGVEKDYDIGTINDNPFVYISLPKTEKKLPQYLNYNELIENSTLQINYVYTIDKKETIRLDGVIKNHPIDMKLWTNSKHFLEQINDLILHPKGYKYWNNQSLYTLSGIVPLSQFKKYQ